MTTRDPATDLQPRAGTLPPLIEARAVTRILEGVVPTTLVHDIDLPGSAYHMVTGVREHDGRLWLGSLHEPAVAVIEL